MNSKYFSILFLTLTLFSCNGQEDIPIELKLSFEFINKNWVSNEIETFKNINENDTTSPRNYHFEIGLYLRNNLLRHNKKSKDITNFFKSLGIHHLDDMSSIILTSYHRYLNGEKINLQSQVDKYVASWKPIIDCEKNQKIKAVEIFNKFKIGDTLYIKMPINENNSAFDYSCSNGNLQWKFDQSKDLLVKGIIKEKYNINSSSNVFFKVKVISKNHIETKIMMENVSIGDEFSFSLLTAWKIE